MTLTELIERAKAVGLQVTTSDIPIIHNGKEVDLWLSLNDDLTVELSGCLKWREK